MQPEIVCMGEPLLEFNQIKGEAYYLPGHGGDTSNCAIAAARQGGKVGYFTAVGDDEFGRSFLDLWKTEGVDSSQVIVNSDAHTGIYFVTHGPKGHVFSYMRAGSAASRVRPKDLPVDYIRGAKVLHVSGISQAISPSACDAVFEAIAIAKAAGVTVCYDSNLRLLLWPLARARAVVNTAMHMAEIVRPGLDDARNLTGLQDPDAIADFYLNGGSKIVAMTLGKEGALVATPTERRRIPTIDIKPIDATAAGDCFGGSFLVEWLKSGDPFKAGLYASVAAAISTTGYGAVAPMPRRPQVEQAMKEAGFL